MLNKLTNSQRVAAMRQGEFGENIKRTEEIVERYGNILIDRFGYNADQVKKILISSCGGEIDLQNPQHMDGCIVSMKELVQLECISEFNGEMAELGSDKGLSPAISINIFVPIELVLDGESSSFISLDELQIVKHFNKQVEKYA